MSKLGQIGAGLYQGKVSFDFVRNWRRWYALSGTILVIAIIAIGVRGLNFGIEFKGGVEFIAQIPNPAANVQKVTDAVVGTGIPEASNPIVVTSGTSAIRIDTKALSLDQQQVIQRAIKGAGATEVNPTSIGPTWGAAVAKKALTGLIVFVILVMIFIWGYFREWRMSVAAIVALIHDLLITVGVYALTGFEVTPATVTGLLTILGYSLYDTVVVFDKVKENTRGIMSSTRRTYADSANLAVNQTLVRSINTSIAALLPTAAILYVGTFRLGSGPLKDLALALFVGMLTGAYSSIFIATPLLSQLKMRDPRMRQQAKRVASRRSQDARSATPQAEAAPSEPERVPIPAGSVADDAELAHSDGVPDREAPTGAPGGEGESAPEPAPPPATGGRGRDPERPRSSSSAKRSQPQRRARSQRSKRR